MTGEVAEVGRSSLHGDASHPFGDRREVPLAHPGKDDAVDRRLGRFEVAGDPVRRHQGGDGDRHDGDLRREACPGREVV